MKALLYIIGITLGTVSAARSVMWLTSYAGSELDQLLAAASAIGMTGAMYVLAARAALPGANRWALNSAVAGLFLLSVFATIDWAESGYQSGKAATSINSLVVSESMALVKAAGSISQAQQANASEFTRIGHLSKSNSITTSATETLGTRRALLTDLKDAQANVQPNTGQTATLLDEYRFALWVLLAVLMDWAGILCLRAAVADQPQPEPEQAADPVADMIASEIITGQHGQRPTPRAIAKHHQLPTSRVTPIFKTLEQQGDLINNGGKYKRAPPTSVAA
jgi:hypothetical protein